MIDVYLSRCNFYNIHHLNFHVSLHVVLCDIISCAMNKLDLFDISYTLSYIFRQFGIVYKITNMLFL